MKSSPGTIEGPLHPTPREYPLFLKFLTRCYGFTDPRWFENDTRYFFGTQPSQLKTKWALKCGHRFAAHVGIFPFIAIINGRPLKVAGIGAVATDPDFRGQGLMKKLMDHIDNQMVQDGFDLSVLWGERGLYQQYGYERALYLDQFTFLKRQLKYFAAPRNIRRARPGETSALQRLFLQHPLRAQRNAAYTASVLHRFRQYLPDPAWVLEEKGKLSAYAVFGKPWGGGLEAAEWGGKTEDVACLFSTVLQNRPEDSFTANIPAGSGLYDWALENCANQVRTCHSCMMKPLNLAGILKAFEPQLQGRYKNLGFVARKAFSLKLEDGKSTGLEMGAKLRVVPKPFKGVPLNLSLSEGARLLFGAGRPSEWLKDCTPSDTAILDSLFPLQWYWWRSDWI